MLYKLYQKHIFPHVLNQVMQTPSLMDLRRELMLNISGEVLEIGFGTGLNLAFYQAVDTVYALEPNMDIYTLSAERIALTPFHVKHLKAAAEQIPLPDAYLEHVVSTWTLCSIANITQSLQEIYRVLKLGGTFHVVEHVLNRENLNMQRLQHLLTPIQKRIADGCHLNRDIELLLLETGFEIQELRYVDAVGIPSIGQRMLIARVTKPV